MLDTAKTSLPAWVTPQFAQETRAVWEPIYGRALSDDEVTEILINVGNLFKAVLDPSKPSPAAQPLSTPVRPRRKQTTCKKGK